MYDASADRRYRELFDCYTRADLPLLRRQLDEARRLARELAAEADEDAPENGERRAAQRRNRQEIEDLTRRIGELEDVTR